MAVTGEKFTWTFSGEPLKFANGGTITNPTAGYVFDGVTWSGQGWYSTFKYGKLEFTVHPDGTIHVTPEALAELLEAAGVQK